MKYYIKVLLLSLLVVTTLLSPTYFFGFNKEDIFCFYVIYFVISCILIKFVPNIKTSLTNLVNNPKEPTYKIYCFITTYQVSKFDVGYKSVFNCITDEDGCESFIEQFIILIAFLLCPLIYCLQFKTMVVVYSAYFDEYPQAPKTELEKAYKKHLEEFNKVKEVELTEKQKIELFNKEHKENYIQ